MTAQSPERQRRVAVIFGGPSNEHEVSLASAQSVLTQMQGLDWDVLAVGVSKDGRWHLGPGALGSLLQQADPTLLPLGVQAATVEAQPVTVYDGPPGAAAFAGYPQAFPVSHGQWGEDGTLQGLLASYGLAVMGAGVTASALCYDKHLTKMVLAAAGLPVTPGAYITAQAWRMRKASILQEISRDLGQGPWFVKPNRGGSSIGARGPVTLHDLPDAVEATLQWDSGVIVENFIPHRELLVGVVGSDKLTVSPPLEAVQQEQVLAYNDKYLGGKLRFAPPENLSETVLSELETMAASTFRALGCNVLSRVDFFVDIRSGQLMVNEVNTIPGLTTSSVFTRLMTAAGLTYPRLLETLYDLAAQ